MEAIRTQLHPALMGRKLVVARVRVSGRVARILFTQPLSAPSEFPWRTMS